MDTSANTSAAVIRVDDTDVQLRIKRNGQGAAVISPPRPTSIATVRDLVDLDDSGMSVSVLWVALVPLGRSKRLGMCLGCRTP